MRKKSVTSALASIGRAAKQNLQLTPKQNRKKDGGRSARRHRHSRGDSISSSGSSFDESSYSDISESQSDYSSSSSEEESKRERRSRKGRGHRYRRSRGDKRHYHERDRRRGRRRDRDRYSPDDAYEYGDYTPQRHHKQLDVLEDDAMQMIDLLIRILPFYGKGDGHSDAVVIDTIHGLPTHALEMADTDGNSLLMLTCQALPATNDLVPLLLSKGCNVNTRNSVGASCLHYSCFADTWSDAAAMVLIRHGAMAEVAEHEFGCTPLHWAAFSGHVELCAALCRAGANPTTLDKNGCDPIHYAKQNGHHAVVQLLESFSRSKVGTANILAPPSPAGLKSPTAPPDEKSEWVRCLDGSTGSSFYHNRDTGESLWGDDYRKVDQAEEQPALDIKSPEKVKPRDAVNIMDTVEQPTSSVTKKPNPSEIVAQKTEEVEIGNDNCHPVQIQGMPTRLPTSKATKSIEETKLTAIAEDLVKTSRHEDVETKVEASQLAAIIEDVVETSSVEDSEPTQTTSQQQESTSVDAKEEHSKDSIIKSEKRPAISRLNSWDADFYADEEEKMQPLPQGDVKQLSIVTAEASKSDDSVDKAAVDESKSEGDSLVPLVNDNAEADSNMNLARNQSFEERISSLHAKMETQLMHRLQHLEDKITQQNLEATTKVEDDSSKMKENLNEMASTIVQLQTEAGTKDLEILSLKQQIVKMETEYISKLKSSMNACVGDGNIHDDSMQVEKEELLAEKARHESELSKACNEIAQLEQQVDQTAKSLSVANERYDQAQRHLEIAEQLAHDEKASRASMKELLEQAQKGGEVDTALTISLQEDKRQAEESILQLKEQIRSIENKMLEERKCHQDTLESMGNEVSQAKEELENAVSTHRDSLSEMKDQHKEVLEQLRGELDDMRSELGSIQGQLKEAKMAKMELMVARDEAVDAMEDALGKARSAETKLQEMTEFVSKTNELKATNEQLHISLQDETEKRKVLHNALEDLKGRIRVYVRVRPLSKTEEKASYVNVMTKEDDRTVVMAGDKPTATDVRDWEFDKIFYGSDADGNTQENVFKDTSLLITSAIDGFNVCIFAYGQTGSGKTYTMLGSGNNVDDETHQGLAPRLANELFRKLAEKESSHHIEVSTSMLELYTDKLRDLLGTGKNENDCLGDLKIRLAEHTSSGLVEVDGAKIERTANAQELLDVFDRGTKGRASSSTKMNADSSRSHMIATIVLSLRNKRTGKIVSGKLTLVDLAGSERIGKSGATGHQLKEAQSINKSLSALGDVIGALTSGGRQHIPYRNHPLTMLMSDSIGGNAKTLMFVCCSPADYNRKETANSLDFAKRCRNVTNNATRASKGGSAGQIRALRAELTKLKDKEKGNGGQAKRRPGKMRRPGM